MNSAVTAQPPPQNARLLNWRTVVTQKNERNDCIWHSSTHENIT